MHEITTALEGLHEAISLAESQPSNSKKDLCQVSKCTRLENYKMILREVVIVLEKTKHSFKSKELAELRGKVQRFLETDGFQNLIAMTALISFF
jgi:hypothetical protein